MASIGFIGLGHMGLPMATHLVQKGHRVTGFDLNPSACQAFAAAGGRTIPHLTELAHDNTIIITMLQTGAQVQDVLIKNPGFFDLMPKNTLFIDCSSIDVADARKLYQEAQQRAITLIDAPVSGGVAGAQAATLTFMVGATPTDFKKVQSILACMGQNIIHTGDPTTGQIAKICNNMILGISMIAISEAFLLAEGLGLSPKKLHEVVTQSSGQCWAMNKYVPIPGVLDNVPANNNYQPGFTTAMMLKDLCSSQHASTLADIHTPMGKKATEIYQKINDTGMSTLDFSVVIKSLMK